MKIPPTAFASCVAASMVQPLVLFGWVVLPELATGGDAAWSTWFVLSVFAVLCAAPFAVLIGIPLSVVLGRRGRFRWWPLAAVGTASAALFAVLLLRGAFGDLRFDVAPGASPRAFERFVLAFAVHGLVGASVFHRVWVRGLPTETSREPHPMPGAD